MEISAIKPTVTLPGYAENKASQADNTAASAKTTADPNQPSALKQVTAKDSAQNAKEGADPLTKDKATQVTENLNKIMRAIDTDLRFQVHEEMNQLMVQVITRKDQEVIKEFPSHELLDTLAAIRDYVGVLLDKKV